jgi:ParB-like chromosome segregation protein Spo0J
MLDNPTDGLDSESEPLRLRCTYCQALIPWEVAPEDVGLPTTQDFVAGKIYPFEGCPCGLGKFVKVPGEADTPPPAEMSSGPTETAVKVLGAQYARLRLDQVRPNPTQPRKFFDGDGIRGLAESIRTCGLLEDILVRPKGDYYEIVLGERRWRASLVAGVAEISAKIVDLDDAEAERISITENIHRENLTDVEEAYSFKAYVDSGHEITTVGSSFGGMEERVAARLRVLNSRHYVAYQQKEIEELTAKVRSLRRQLRDVKAVGKFVAEIVDESELVARLEDGYEVAAVFPDGRCLVRKRA